MKSILRWLKLFGLIIFSAGWIVPFYQFGMNLIDFSLYELARRVAPEFYGKYVPTNFPHIPYSDLRLHIACIWLTVVVVFWVVIAVRLSEQKKKERPETSG